MRAAGHQPIRHTATAPGTEEITNDANTREHQHHGGKDERSEHDRRREVGELAAHEAASMVCVEDDVERPARGLKVARRAIERHHNANHQSSNRSALALQSGTHGRVERRQRRRGNDSTQVVDDRVVGPRKLS